MIRRMILAAALTISSIAQPAFAQDSIASSTAPAPTIVRLPLVRLVNDGDRVVMQVIGSTEAPIGSVNGAYVGPSGYVTTAAEATDIKGAPGGDAVANPVPGPMGAPGKSAYQIWLDAGNEGGQSAFLASLRGQQGIAGGNGNDGAPGADGKSAYQLWLDAGNTGDAAAFLASLRGADGSNGTNGADGQPAQLRVQGGFVQWSNGGAWANLIAIADLVGAKGDKGDTGATGSAGADGHNATITIGAVSTGAPGSNAIVSNVGTLGDAVWNITIPRGTPGNDGSTGPAGPAGGKGDAATIAVGTITTGAPGSNASCSNAGSSSAAILNCTFPRGDVGAQGAQGVTGPTPAFSIGSISTLSPGASATASITGSAGNPVLNLGLPAGVAGTAGATGSTGQAATISIGTVSTLAANASPTVTNSGTSSAAVLNFGIPRGAIFLNDVILTQTAAVSIALGPRTLTVSTNCVVGDRMFMTPSAAMPAGYQLGDIVCTANGTAQATLYAPLLAIGASYSITVKVTAFR